MKRKSLSSEDAEASQESRITTFWKKLAMIFQAAEDQSMTISEANARRAVALMDWLLGNYRRLLTTMNETAAEKHGKAIQRHLEKGKAATRTELQQFCHLRKWELEEALETLLESGAIKETKIKAKNGKETASYQLA